MRTINLLLFVFLSTALYAQKTYYVNQVSGKNTNSGLSPDQAVGLTANGTLPSSVLSVLAPGDTVYFIGIFTNPSYSTSSAVGLAVDHPRFWNTENTLRFSNLNGAEGKYITLKAYDSSTVIKCDGGNSMRFQNCSFLHIEGFTIEGEVERMPLALANSLQFVYIVAGTANLSDPAPSDIRYRDKDCISNCNDTAVVEGEVYTTLNPNDVYRPTYTDTRGLYLSDVHHIEIRNNHIHHMPGGGLRVSDCEDILLIGNEINDCSRRSSGGTHGLVVTKATSTRSSDDYRISIMGNKVHHNYNEQYSWAPDKIVITPHIDEGKGISLQRNQTTSTVNWDHGRILIANNSCYFNGFSGIHSNDGDRIDVINNTCYFNSYTKSITEWNGVPDSNGGNIGISIQDGSGHRIVNNISIIDNRLSRSAIASNLSKASDLLIKDNIIYGTDGPLGKQDERVESIAINTQMIDPLFVNASMLDFRLMSNSPAIDRADSSYAPVTDYFNNPRLVPDIGAFEYQATAGIGGNLPLFNALQLYPNPTSSKLILFIGSTAGKAELFSSIGQLIAEYDLHIGENNLDVSQLPEGLYFVRLGSQTKKFIKNNQH